MSDETVEEVVPLDTLVRIYRKIKTRLEVLTKEYDTASEQLKAQQDEIRFAMQAQMKALGITSSRTEYGTISMFKKTRYSTSDWDSFKKFMTENDALDLLEKRIAQTNMAQYLEENPGSVPPGLNSTTEYDVRITKPAR